MRAKKTLETPPTKTQLTLFMDPFPCCGVEPGNGRQLECGASKVDKLLGTLPRHAKKRAETALSQCTHGQFVGERAFRKALPVCIVAGPQKWIRTAQCPVCLEGFAASQSGWAPDQEMVSIAHDSPGHANACAMTLGRGGCHFACFSEMARRQAGTVCEREQRDSFACPLCRLVVSARHLFLVRQT